MPTFTIDQLQLDHCDLIQLDVEGREWHALVGALHTLSRHRPVVMLEAKNLPQGSSHGQAIALLKQFGYRQVAAAHRDIVFKC